MVMPQTRRFNLDLEPFAAVRRFIERFCASAHVAPRTSDNLILIVDELSANTMDHGYPSAKHDITERSIWLTLSVADRNIVALYEDAAPAHDPFQTIIPPDYSGLPENWRIGGWGIPLVAKLANNLRYERAGGRNRIRFTLPIDGPQE
jgi:anti-sigma regulatory factor (Ser/Thr protein kinase)